MDSTTPAMRAVHFEHSGAPTSRLSAKEELKYAIPGSVARDVLQNGDQASLCMGPGGARERLRVVLDSKRSRQSICVPAQVGLKGAGGVGACNRLPGILLGAPLQLVIASKATH